MKLSTYQKCVILESTKLIRLFPISLALALALALAAFAFPNIAKANSLFGIDWNTASGSTYTSGATLNSRSVSISQVDTYSGANTGNVYNASWTTMFGSSYDFDSNRNYGFSYAVKTTGAVTTLSFSSAVTDPYVMFTYADTNSVGYDFSGNGVGSVSSIVASAGSGSASLSGDVVTASGYGNTSLDGFIVKLSGTFTSITFNATSTGSNDTGVVSVALDGYSVSTTIGSNGSGSVLGDTLATGNHTQVVEATGSETLTYTFTAATNYKLDTANSTSSCGGTLAASYTTSAIVADCSISVAFIEAVAPTLSSSTPADGATGVAVGSNIVLTFNENILAGTGNITLYDSGDNVVEAFDVTTDVTISGATVTLDPANDLSSLTGYYVQVAATAIDDAAGNSFAGISDKTTLNFTTADVVGPTLSSSSPSDGATGVAVGANIVLTFSENVQAGTGNIVISDGASDTRTIAIGDAQVSISGAVVTINPTANLSSSTSYYVQVASTAIEDTSGNAYAGISDTTTLNFTTVDTAAPTATFSPLNGATDVAVDANITITFNEAIRLVNDSALTDSNVDALITLKDTNSSGSNIAFDATISGNVITVNPSSDFSVSQQVYVAIGTTVEDVSDNAYAGGSATFTVVANTQTPATEFAANETAIRTVLIDDMMRSVRSSLSVSRRMISDARNRLIAYDRDEQILASSRSPLTLDGVVRADAVTASTRGTASSSFTRNGGAFRRLFFSDFDIQHNTDTDSTTATLSARVTWEHMTSDSTMLGYFVGVEAAESDLNGTFAGDQTRLGVSAGGYLAHKLADQLYMDAYVSIGVGHSELDMSNGTLALESDYRSETVTTGAALSGVYEYDAYEFRPEIAFNYGKTELGQVFFTGRAYGMVDDTLTLNAGSVSVANLTLRPEVRMDIDEVRVLPGAGILSFSPRLICERTMSTRRTQNCGGGAEVGYAFQSKDGLRNIDLNIAMDEVGSARRTSAVVGVEMRF